jgi:hypothetical protein
MKENLYLTENTDHSTLKNIESGIIISIPDNNEHIVWTATPMIWINPEKSFFTSYSEIESRLEQTGIFTATTLLPRGTYAICISEQTSTAKATIVAVANALEYNSFFNPIILD